MQPGANVSKNLFNKTINQKNKVLTLYTSLFFALI